MKAERAITVPGRGDPCPRCAREMEIREHRPGWRPQPGRAYYSRWFRCVHPDCRTREVMPLEFMCMAEAGTEPSYGNEGG